MRLLWILLPLFTALLAPTGAWPASVSQNIPITITAATQPAFYVATNGSDSNAGTLVAPFATLGKCQTAMQNSSTIKTCFLRAGTYSLTASSDLCGIGQNEALALGTSDAGETWAVYPPDGIGAAIIDGGSSGSQTGVQWGICTNAGSSSMITFNGLTFQHFDRSAIYAMSPVTMTNNIFQFFYNIQYLAPGFSLAAAATFYNAPRSIFSNNYVTQSVGNGIRVSSQRTSLVR
jgi:hypothetical protein